MAYQWDIHWIWIYIIYKINTDILGFGEEWGIWRFWKGRWWLSTGFRLTLLSDHFFKLLPCSHQKKLPSFHGEKSWWSFCIWPWLNMAEVKSSWRSFPFSSPPSPAAFSQQAWVKVKLGSGSPEKLLKVCRRVGARTVDATSVLSKFVQLSSMPNRMGPLASCRYIARTWAR